MKKYCIFRVYDYKGGELNSRVNLTREGVVEELSEQFEGLDFDSLQERRAKKINKVLDEDDSSVNEIKDLILKQINKPGFYSTYAGGEGFCGKIYEVENNNLSVVSLNSFVDEIAAYIDKNWIN